MDRRTFLSMTLTAPVLTRIVSARQSNAGRAMSWTQWGGPHRNFQTEASGLRDTWPASGPRVVWKRALGGYLETAQQPAQEDS